MSVFIAVGVNECILHVYAQNDMESDNEILSDSNFTDSNLVGEDDPFYTENTKSNNLRVLSIDPIPSVEVTYEGNSSIDGSPNHILGTIIDTMGKDGLVHSEGKAIILTPMGEIIAYRTESIGHYNPDGSFSDSGIIFFTIPFSELNNTNKTSQHITGDGSYSVFNNLMGIYKKTVDPSGNGLMKVWKWGEK
ncbi:MAG: hypothetical protein R2685_15305 [Candidatus Nitrosocosmicus sp.]|nr:hypothetical protein [Candidatus Nitrosocosmicus sp.]